MACIKIADLEDNLNPSRGPVPAGNREKYERALARLMEALGVLSGQGGPAVK